jgi:hypothetical protein
MGDLRMVDAPTSSALARLAARIESFMMCGGVGLMAGGIL